MSRNIVVLASAFVLTFSFMTGPTASADTGDGGGSCRSDNYNSTNATISTFFASSDAFVQWDQDESPPTDTAPWAVQMTLGPTGSFAGFCLNGFNDQAPPPQPPSFWFKPSRSQGSLGSPRLVIEFLGATPTSADNIQLRPLSWTANVWQQEGGANAVTSNDWESHGGCGFEYEVQYSVAMACHAGEIVQDVFVVEDSTPGTDYTQWIDEITYGPACLTAPGSAYNKNNQGDCTSDFLSFPLTIL
jgi:hypothetical protein